MSQDEGDDSSGGIINKLRSRYAFRIVFIVLFVAAVLGGLAFFTLSSVQASVQDDAEESLASAAEREAAGLDDFVASRDNDTRRISSNGELTSMDASAVEQNFEEELVRLPESVVAISLFNDADDEVVATADRTDSSEPPLNFDNLENVTTDLFQPNGVQSFDPYLTDDRRRVLGFTSKVDDGEENHVVVVVVDLETRGQLLTSPVDNSGVEVVSHRQDGQVVLGQSPESLGGTPGYVTELDYLASGDYGGTQTRVETASSNTPLVDDSNQVIASSKMDTKGWSVVVVASQSSTLATVDDVRQSLLILIGVALLGLVVVGVVIIRDINNALDKTTNYATQIEQGNLAVDIDHSRKDEFGQLSGQFARIRDALKDQIRGSEQARKEAEVARAEAEELASYLRDKAEEYSEVMQEVGSGDMTQRMEADGEEDSMDQIAEEFNEMIEELEKTTGQLKSYVDEVEESGAEVEQSARTVREASEQVAESIQKISDDAYDQKERIEGIIEAMDEVADELEQIDADHPDISMDGTLGKIEETSTDLNEVATLSEETMSVSEEVAGASEEQAAELNTVSERANDLQQYAQPLRDILERFETEKEHEFVFTVGPTGGASRPGGSDDEGDDEN